MPELVTKEWHMSPPKASTSQFFGVIEWDKMPMIKVGLSEKELRKISPGLTPFKKMDVLLYSISPRGLRYEIGILMADGRVADLSYKAVSESFENTMLGSGYLHAQSNTERKKGESGLCRCSRDDRGMECGGRALSGFREKLQHFSHGHLRC